MLFLVNLAVILANFYLCPRGGKVPLLTLHKTKWLARWVGLGTTIARKAVALEAERFGGPKEQNV
jgi:hypothetical protein